jgi:hypothetical protein
MMMILIWLSQWTVSFCHRLTAWKPTCIDTIECKSTWQPSTNNLTTESLFIVTDLFPTRKSLARCHCYCRLNLCRLFHCHHWSSRSRINHHDQSMFCWDAAKSTSSTVSSKLSNILPPLCFHCYSARLIINRWFKWCYCHCCWRWRRHPFAMVHPFRVEDVVWRKTCAK